MVGSVGNIGLFCKALSLKPHAIASRYTVVAPLPSQLSLTTQRLVLTFFFRNAARLVA